MYYLFSQCQKSFVRGLLSLCFVFSGIFFNQSFAADVADFPLELTLVNNSGFPEEQVYLMVLGSGQKVDYNTHFGYLDFSSHAFVETGTTDNFSLDVATMARTLKEIKALSGDNTYTIKIPKMVSSRVYFSFGDNFDQCPSFASSGPPNGKTNTVVYDKMEFDTWDNPNMNTTNVDFFSVSYSVAATDKNTGKRVSRGYFKSRQAVFDAFENIPGTTTQQYGNTKTFGSLIIKRTLQDDVDKVRILAPKNPAFTDFDSSLASAPQKTSHFFDEYINNHCWKPNRQFLFYSKLYDPSNPTVNNEIYYGQVSADGMTLNLYTDSARTVAYVPVPSLPRPSSNNFSFPDSSQWHHVDSVDSNDIDWGYLLGGQVAGTNKGADFASDPVAMAILISIVRGVMHHYDGRTEWTDSSLYYPGDPVSKASTAEYPIYYYSKLVHDLSIENMAYGLSLDDVYAASSAVYFSDPKLTLTFNEIKTSGDLASLVMAVSPESAGTSIPTIGTHTNAYNINQKIDISATAAAGYHFTGWTVIGNANITDKALSATTATITGTDTTPTITANFSEDGTASTLTMAVTPDASGTTTPAVGDHSYQQGEPVQITAASAAGYHFTGWSKTGNVSVKDKTKSTTTATLSGDTGTVTATFALDVTATTLTMAVSPVDSGFTTPTAGEHQYNDGEIVNITATSVAGYHFTGWSVSGNSTIADKLNTSTTVSLSGTACTVTASFSADSESVTLTMAVSPDNSGTVSPGAGTHSVNKDQAITIIATSADSYYFAGWTCTAGATVSDVSDENTAVKLTSDATLTATFSTTPVSTVAVGSIVNIAASDLGVGEVTDFQSKPLVTVEYTDPLKAKDRKASLSVVTKIDKANFPTSVNANWRTSVKLYNQKDYSDKTNMLYTLLAAKPISGFNSNSFNVKYKTAGKTPISINKSIYLAPPAITNISNASTAAVQAGDILTISGKYFGSKRPKIYVEYYTESATGDKTYKLKASKVLTKSDAGTSYVLFKNAKEKANGSYMKVFSDDDVYTPPKDIGYSEVKIAYPKLKADKQIATGYIVIKNSIGMATQKMD
jgi:List-Bact-rpt repeat protein